MLSRLVTRFRYVLIDPLRLVTLTFGFQISHRKRDASLSPPVGWIVDASMLTTSVGSLTILPVLLSTVRPTDR